MTVTQGVERPAASVASTALGPRSVRAGRRSLLIALAVALLVRVVLAVGTSDLPVRIEDEQHYAQLATTLFNGDGFGWDRDRPTSIRPPLYPFFLASIWHLSGAPDARIVRWAQIPIAVLGVVLVYLIGLRWFDERTALLAALGVALYPALLFSGVLLLTETLFTTVLLLFLLGMTRLEERSTPRMAALTGIALGLSALVRSVLWPFILVAAPIVWLIARPGRRHRVAVTAALVLGYAIVVGPWAIRNTRLQHTLTVVDTMGGLNLLMGNYAHTPEQRMWDAVSLTGPMAWNATLPPTAADGSKWTEGTKEKWAQRQAISYMVAHPLTTLRRSVLKFADFWGLERDFVAGVHRGYYQPAQWLFVLGAGATILVYPATAVLAVVGICLAPPRRRVHLLGLVLVLFVCGVHTIVFGHSRYHLPLIPILMLYAAAAATSGTWRQLFSGRRAATLALAMTLLLAFVWMREILVRDWDRIRDLVVG
jgi:4-amino-4-deoxy-L-arabinose transferase-like glycosyltransferase